MAAEALGGIDGVVNSAGIAADIPALDTPVELFRKILDVNVVGTFIVARAAARVMKDTGGGAIVNISSVSGVRGSKGRSAYGASKGAVIVLTQVLANDLARYGIRVNAVAPGPVDTPMVEACTAPATGRCGRATCRCGATASPRRSPASSSSCSTARSSSYVTGEIVAVDGGFRGTGISVDE